MGNADTTMGNKYSVLNVWKEQLATMSLFK